MGKKSKQKQEDKLEQKMEKMEQNVSALEIAQSLYTKAEEIAKQQEKKFNEGLQKNKEGDWYLTMLKKGTATDRISSLAMLVQKEPMSTLSYLMQLLSLTKKSNRKMAEQAIGALKDLFINDFMVPEDKKDQKLSVFTRNPLILHKKHECTSEDLMNAYYEHCLREILRDFVTTVLQQLSHGDLEFYRMNALAYLREMLPFSRQVDLLQTSLSLVVNKFGDSSRKV